MKTGSSWNILSPESSSPVCVHFNTWIQGWPWPFSSYAGQTVIRNVQHLSWSSSEWTCACLTITRTDVGEHLFNWNTCKGAPWSNDLNIRRLAFFGFFSANLLPFLAFLRVGIWLMPSGDLAWSSSHVVSLTITRASHMQQIAAFNHKEEVVVVPPYIIIGSNSNLFKWCFIIKILCFYLTVGRLSFTPLLGVQALWTLGPFGCHCVVHSPPSRLKSANLRLLRFDSQLVYWEYRVCDCLAFRSATWWTEEVMFTSPVQCLRSWRFSVD